VKRTQSSLACELNVRAVDALDAAREMSPGDEARRQMKTAKILGNAAEIHKHFFGKPAK
jgi:hypothetical protein